MLPTSYQNKYYYRCLFIKNILTSIKLIILKQIETKISELENITFFSGLLDFLNVKQYFQKDNNFYKEYSEIIKILKDNWSSGLNKKEKIIEKTLMEFDLGLKSDDEDN